MTIDTFLEYNFAPIIGIIFQIVILFCSKSFKKKEKIIFGATIGLEVLELVCYNIEFILGNLDHSTVWRTIFSVIGYILRPALVYPLVLLIRDGDKSKLSKIGYFDLIPLGFIIIVEQFAFYTDWVFYFTADNHFVRGPLGFTSQIITIIYIVEASAEVLLNKFFNKKFNIGLIIVVMLYVSLAMVFESIFDIHSLGINAGVFSIVFFMFAIQTSRLDQLSSDLKVLSETDGLSQISNRYSGEKQIDAAISKGESGLFAVLDVDKFKHINDTYGHAIGDEAIIKVAQTLKDNLRDDDVIMRLGGDEFAMFSTHVHNGEEAKEAIDNLFQKISEIRLSADDNFKISVSIGLAKFDGVSKSSFDTLYRIADAKLYEAKKFEGNYVAY